jgi:cell wall-associated NlpC family hydrolase
LAWTRQMISLRLTQVGDLIGMPHVLGARGPDAYDCWGLCVEVYSRAGVRLPDYGAGALTREHTKELLDNYVPNHALWIQKPEDWCFAYSARPGHLGLCIQDRVLHSARKLGVVLQKLDQFKMIYPNVMFARWRDE